MAWRPRPPSWPWLLAHEARLLWRMSGGARLWLLLALGGFFTFASHLAGYFFMRRFDLEAVVAARPGIVIFVSAFVILMVLSAAFGLAVSALFGRGDMDLLVSSPVPIRDVYTVRAMAVGFASVALLVYFWMPIADMGPVHGHWGALAAYPVLVAIGMMCAALAFAGTLALVRLLGPRRAQVTAQIVGAFTGAFLVLAMQFETVLPKAARESLRAWLVSEESPAWLGPHSVLTWPARALFGDPLPLIATLAVCIGVFVLVTRLTARAFASAVQDGAALTARRRSVAKERRFASGLARIVITKELKLITRDPALIARSLVQLLYFVPLMVILARNAHLAAVLAASLVALAASLAGTLAYITVSGEEAPDLVGTAPVSGERVRWLKAAAALGPVVILVAPFLAWYAMHSLFIFGVLLVCLAAALLSSAVIQVWSGVPGSARDLRVRNKQNPLLNIVEALSSLGWAAACYLAVAGNMGAAAAAAAFGLVGPLAAWLSAWMREDS